MRCDACGREDAHFNFAAEYLKDGHWHRGLVCWECQKLFAPAIREKQAARASAEPTAKAS
jgi:hypothetical protein